jgi:hypothetical protein
MRYRANGTSGGALFFSRAPLHSLFEGISISACPFTSRLPLLRIAFTGPCLYFGHLRAVGSLPQLYGFSLLEEELHGYVLSSLLFLPPFS